MSELRKCDLCNEHLPPETAHFFNTENNEHYCESCVVEEPYTAYTYYDLSTNFIGSGDEIDKVEEYEDYYEEES